MKQKINDFILLCLSGDSDFEGVNSLFVDNMSDASVNNNLIRKCRKKLSIDYFFRKSCKLLSIIIK